MSWRKARRNSFDPDVLLDRDDQGPSADFMESLKERVGIVIVIVIVVIIVIYNNKSWTWVTTLQTLSVSRVSQHNTRKKIKQNLGTGGSFHVTDMENIHSLVFHPMEVLMMTDEQHNWKIHFSRVLCTCRPGKLSTTKVWSVGEGVGENRWLVWFPILCHYHQYNIAMSIIFTICCSWITSSEEGWGGGLIVSNR